MIKFRMKKALSPIVCRATYAYAYIFQYMRVRMFVPAVLWETVRGKHKSENLFIKMKKVLNMRKESE